MLGALAHVGKERALFVRRFAPLQLQHSWEGG
jgi:hypothetical protein